MVIAWWNAVWTSPMAAEYLEADKHRLFKIAILHNEFWFDRTPASRMRLAAEIRQQEVPLGLTPIDRRRLQWEVEKGEEAEERTSKRRQRKTAVETSKKDPRDVLKVVEGGAKKAKPRKSRKAKPT